MLIVKKIFKWLLRIFLVLFIVANLVIIFSGKFYIYRAIYYTYLHGQSGPGIFDKEYFYSRTIKSHQPQPWPVSKNYNKHEISKSDLGEIENLKPTAFLVIHNDSILHEQYWGDISANDVSNSFSMAKSVVGILIGVALAEGKIKSLDDPVANYLPDFKEGRKSRITIRHVMAMASGMDWSESSGNPFSDNAEAYYGTDLEAHLERIEYNQEPGKAFEYESGNTQILAFIIEKVSGKTLSEYASEKLWKPLGAETDAYWSLDHENGKEKAYCCIYSTPRDFARLGKLMLHNGNWKGKQILTEEFVQQSIVPAAPLDEEGKPNKKYGLTWWTVKHKDMQAYYARGILGQYLICIPQHNLVVVRMGHKRGEKKDDHPMEIFHYIDTALKMLRK